MMDDVKEMSRPKGVCVTRPLAKSATVNQNKPRACEVMDGRLGANEKRGSDAGF